MDQRSLTEKSMEYLIENLPRVRPEEHLSGEFLSILSKLIEVARECSISVASKRQAMLRAQRLTNTSFSSDNKRCVPDESKTIIVDSDSDESLFATLSPVLNTSTSSETVVEVAAPSPPRLKRVQLNLPNYKIKACEVKLQRIDVALASIGTPARNHHASSHTEGKKSEPVKLKRRDTKLYFKIPKSKRKKVESASKARLM